VIRPVICPVQKPIDLVELLFAYAQEPSHPSQSAAGCCAEQSGWPSAYRFVEPGRCSVSMVRWAAFETLSLLAAHRVCAFP
jgi:hypothetical protein